MNFLLQLKQPIEKSFSCWRATRYIDVNRHNAITTPNNWIWVMVVASSISTAPHWNYPPWLWHLVINSGENCLQNHNSDHERCSITGRSNAEKGYAYSNLENKPSHKSSIRFNGRNPNHNITHEKHLLANTSFHVILRKLG
jgi:hypothetical protein